MPSTQRNPVELVKRAAQEAVRAGKPVEFRFGTVLSTEPLEIRIDQKAPLQAGQLLLSRNVTDYEVDVTINYSTEATSGGGTYEAFSAHAHRCAGRKKIIIHNALVAGDVVVLLQLQGGKKFLVLERMQGHPALEGAWG